MVCLWSGTPGVLDIFCSSTQVYILFSTYICLISFLYLDLYVLGDETSISKGYFMRTKHLRVLIHIRNKVVVGAIKHVQAHQ